MNLFEFEGKELLREYGIAVPASRMLEAGAPAPLAYPFVAKAQTLTGGRGKAGGVRVCRDRAELEKNVPEILALQIKGHAVHGVLAEELVTPERELYIAITLQGVSRPTLIACAHGGMDIEELAKRDGEQLLRLELDPFTGLTAAQRAEIANRLALPETAGLDPFLDRLQRCFFETEALLVEINPLGLVGGRLLALDAKIELDDHTQARYPEHFARLRQGRAGLSGYREKVSDGTTITFVPLEGEIGLISDGAGTGMLTLDILHDLGGRAASFCELGGTTPASTMYKALEYTLSGPRPLKSLLIILIGGFNRMDDMARGITEYMADHGLTVPVFTRMVGTMEEEGKQIMAEAGLTTYDGLLEAATAAVEAAGR